MKIAVIGTGISGNTCAHLLANHHDLTVFESADYVGGHANTVAIEAYGGSYEVDTGFMVYNDRTYPNFVRLLNRLEIDHQPSDMSFSVRCERTNLEYQGSGLNGLFAQRRNFWRPAFWWMLRDILRFNREAPKFLAAQDDSVTMRSYVQSNGYGQKFIEQYLIPMGSAIWSARPDRFLDFPAHFLIQFFHNHGLLQIVDRPRWKTISGRSKNYVDRLITNFRDRIRLRTPVSEVTRYEDRVVVRGQDCLPESFDAVILATHADQSLRMLTDASPLEREILGKFAYQKNETVVHTDPSLLPKSRRAWASWNYHIPKQPQLPVAVTYDVNRLQSLGAPGPICVTLNHTNPIDPAKVVSRIEYQHPVFSTGAIEAQRRRHEINGTQRTWFCGAYWGYGFHEDGVNSALAVANDFDISFDLTLTQGVEHAQLSL